MKRLFLCSVTAGSLLAAPTATMAQDSAFRTTLNNYGGSGLLDLPVASQLPDGEFVLSAASYGAVLHTALTFQILPRLQGSFRYSGVRALELDGFTADQTYFDRSFDLRFQLLRESRYLPDLTIGLQDFVGTGLYGAEYLVATKTIHPRVRVTGGLGWGRLGSHGAIGSPLGPRPGGVAGTGGTPTFERWFRGPMAPFAGIEWQATDKLGFKLEYSSDSYAVERANMATPIEYRSPINVGVEYQIAKDFRVGLSYMHGSTIGFSVKMTNNPSRPRIRGVAGAAPQPIPVRSNPRTNPQDWATGWAESRELRETVRDGLAEKLKAEGLGLEALVLRGDRAELRLRNTSIDAGSQAIGRAARAMAASLPTSVEHFDIVPVTRGIPAAMVRLRRSDLESLEFSPSNSAQLRERIELRDAAGRLPPDAMRGAGLYPKLDWSLGPYTTFELFDPRMPIRPELGVRLKANFDIAPGLKVYGAAKYRLYGGLADFVPLPFGESLAEYKVRSEAYRYESNPFALETLAVAWHARPGPNLYSRISAGYLERHFAGVSGEVLWKPVNSRFALGAELNYVQQRDPNSVFGMHPTYGADVTGHVSAYYEFENGILAQLDVGRYLARDIGATLTLEREFANGWRVGAFATLTNMTFTTFGEGAFDKGVTVTIPLNWALGTPTRRDVGITLRPVSRDGGAKLAVEDRLYGSIREYHAKRLDDQWGRVWR